MVKANGTRMTRKKGIGADQISFNPFFSRHPRAILSKLKEAIFFKIASLSIIFKSM